MSFFSDLFVVKVRSGAPTAPTAPLEKGAAKAAGATDTAGAKESGVPVFLTVKTLGSFATGTFFVTLVWKLLKVMLPASDWVVSPWTAAGISLVYGVAVFCASVSDPDARPKNSGAWIAAVIVALFNSLLLTAAALGILGLIGSNSSAPGSH